MDVEFRQTDKIGVITLNRPRVLNALTHEMFLQIGRQLEAWRDEEAIGAIAICGSRRQDGTMPFCAGGDLRALYEGRDDPERTLAHALYRDEYRLNTKIFRYPKPYVALIDGVVMGGGVGVSIHGSHRVMTENAVFAMPETGIGLFPDIGATHFLTSLPGRYGLYLGLTGARLGVADAVYLGLATHFVPSERIASFEQELHAIPSSADANGAIERILGDYSEVPPDPPIADIRNIVDRCFQASSVEDIVRNLARERCAWARNTIDAISEKSPTSLKVTFKQLAQFGGLEFEDAMRMEYRIAIHCNLGHDFFEGIRAQIIDKDRQPIWSPLALESVSDQLVDWHFEALESGDLELE